MAEDKPTEEGVREWLARRLGENLPPRPRPVRPPQRRAPSPEPPPRRVLTSTLIPRGETPRGAPVTVGPAPRRHPLRGRDLLPIGGGPPGEREDTAELIDLTSLGREDRLPADELIPEDELPTRDHAPTRRVQPSRALLDPAPAVAPPRAPPAPDQFTADGRFASPVPVQTREVRDEAPEVSLDPISVDLSDPLGPETDGGADDPVTRRLPPTDDEERLTGELFPPLVPSAGPHPTPTVERIEPAAVAVIEQSETLRLPPEPERVEAPSFEQPATPDAFLFGQREADTVVLNEDEEEERRGAGPGLMLAIGAALGVTGFAVSLLLFGLWFWLLAA